MAPSLRCQICKSQTSKYSCPSCRIPYCSVACYKGHKSTSCLEAGPASRPTEQPSASLESQVKASQERDEEVIPDAQPKRPLTSLKWPYIPEESSFPDPLKRDDPKLLQLHHYEAIATSSEVRSALSSNPTLPALLRRLDKLRGPEREDALERLLGVDDHQAAQRASHRKRAPLDFAVSDEDQKGLKELAESVEKAVRGENRDTLGLDWAEDGRHH